MSNTLIEAKAFFDQNELIASLEAVNRVILYDHENRDAFLLRARIHYKIQQWGESDE